MVDRDDHNIALLGQRPAFLRRQEDGGTVGIAASVEPDEHGPLPTVQRRGPDVEHLAVL